MYFIKYGKEYLHDLRVDDKRRVFDASLSGEENSCGFFDFTIYPDHPLHNKLKELDADNPIEIFDDGDLLFSGFVYELGEEFYNDGHVKCKGELEYLKESIVRPYSTLQRGYGKKAPTSVNGYFEWLIQQHNDQVKANKQFVIGVNQGSALDPNNYIFRENDKYPTTIDEISEKLLKNDNVGGFIRSRHENGIRYIDYLSEWTSLNTQVLDFGVNLTDYSQTDDSSSVATFVIPLGAKMSETAYSYNDGYFKTSDTSVNTSKEYYTKTDDGYSKCSNLKTFETGTDYYEYNEDNDESNLPLTIEGVGYGSDGYIANEDYIYSEKAVAKYGLIGTKYENQDLTTKESLIEKGITALKELVSPKRTIEIKAVDMHLINPDIKPIKIGEYVRVRSVPHNLDSYFLCASIDLDLNNPENSIYTLGTTFDTLTGQQNKKINELNNTVNKQYEAVDKKSESTATSAKDASEIAALARNQAQSAYDKAEQAASESIAATHKADEATANVTLIQNDVTRLEGETDTATETANQAAMKAEEAQVAANASAEKAGEANAIANEIKSQIDDVKGDATSLRDAIENQIETKASTMTADFAKKTDLTSTETTLRSEISQSAAAVKSEVEQSYVKKTDLTDVETNLQTSIKQNSDSITSTAKEVTTVKANLTTAQNGVDEAKKLANDAQSFADAAGENAYAAQASADTATELANQTQANLNNLDAAVAVKFSEVKQTTDGISSTVGEYKAKVDNLSVGGRNLYLGTRKFDGSKWCNLEEWETWEQEDYPYKEYGRTGPWRGIYQEVNVEEGKEYTFSFFAKGDSVARVNVYTDWESTATTPDSVEIGEVSTDSYKRYSVTFTSNITGIIKPRVENSSEDSWLQICGLKFEEGNVPTDWTPAPEDAENAIKTAESNIDQNAKNITATVETVDDHENRISILQQTSEGFTARLDKFQIGGRNLLGSTDEYRYHTGTGGENECSYIYDTTEYYRNLPSLDGKQVTLSFDWEATATSGTFRIELNDTPWAELSENIEVSESSQNGHSEMTVVCDSGFNTGNYWGVQLRSDYLTGTVTIKNMMFETGSKASSWHMSPEDEAWFIGEAGKSATNYLGFSDAGLVIGDMTRETLGRNVLIDDDEVSIRDGETKLASFQSSGMRFEKPVVFKADGIMLDNGDAFSRLGQNQILWSHPTGYYMHGTQSITFSANISRQLSGAVFAWCRYQNGSATNSNWLYFFVPKTHVSEQPGNGVRMSDPYLGVMKYLYISNSGAAGVSDNATSGTTNGIVWNNQNYVLRYVIGV